MILDVSPDKYLIVLEKGEKLIESMTRLIQSKNIQAGMLSGIGGIKNVELGYYDIPGKDYNRQVFSDDPYELIALSGNVVLLNNAPFIHAHVVLGRPDFSTFGGHLFEAEIAVTAEITVIPFKKAPHRVLNEACHLALIQGLGSESIK